MKPRSTSVPKAMQARYDAVTDLTDTFCAGHLDKDYRDLARNMAAALARKRPSPLSSGQPRTWACGIVHLLGSLNFLSDKATRPHMLLRDVATNFGVGESTASAKARVIETALGTSRMDPAWMLPGIATRSPFMWVFRHGALLDTVLIIPGEDQEANTAAHAPAPRE